MWEISTDKELIHCILNKSEIVLCISNILKVPYSVNAAGQQGLEVSH